MTPELWRRCPDCGGRGTNRGGWPCKTCAFGYAERPPQGLVRVPFDEAAARMAQVDGIDSDYGFLTEAQCRTLLRAALGEDT